MKKVILSLVFVFGIGTTIMNAYTNLFVLGDDCTAAAWLYGTEAGDGDPVLEYEYTNQYFDLHCNPDGTFKIKKNPDFQE